KPIPAAKSRESNSSSPDSSPTNQIRTKQSNLPPAPAVEPLPSDSVSTPLATFAYLDSEEQITTVLETNDGKRDKSAPTVSTNRDVAIGTSILFL
ncbi:unnamed protein product, partial [Allacma fusca]